jgi:hypothetical protein
MRRRRYSRLTLFYGIVLTALLVGGSVWLDRQGQPVVAAVTSKAEEISVTHEPQGGWHRHYRVGTTFGAAGALSGATVTVDQRRYDALRVGDSVAIRYLPALPLYARTADRSTATVAAEMVRQILGSNVIIWVGLGLLAMVIAARIGMVPAVLAGLLWLGAGYAWLLRSPATPVPAGTEATARVSRVTLVAKSPARRGARRRLRAYRSDAIRRLAQPYQVVELLVPLQGRPDSMLAVDAVDSGSVAGLAVGAVLPVRHPPGDARGARLMLGTRTFADRNRYHYLPLVILVPLLGMLGAYGFRWRRARAKGRAGAAAGLLIACALAGCREQGPGVERSAGPPRILKLEELSAAEKRYGHSATPNPAVTYQPDVVTLPAGAEAIRGVSADGLVWTIDPDSKGIEDVQPGKVLLLTSRAAGRVLGVQQTDDGLRVVLGPVEITEVIRDGRFSLDQAIDLDQALSFKVPDMFDPAETVAPIVTSSASPGRPCEPHRAGQRFFLASARPRCDPGIGAVRAIGMDQATAHRFSLTTLVDSRGIGVRIVSDESGVRFLGEAALFLNAPRLFFNLDIRGGKIVVCEVQLNGAAGIMMTFEAASPTPTSGNIEAKRFAPVDFSIPVTGMGVPFAVNVRQIFQLQTAFTSTGNLRARVYFKLTGGLRVGYRDGSWSMGGPTGVTPVENLDNLLLTTQGAAVGVTGMVMTHHANVMVGIGAFGFLTGPYGFLNSSVTVTRGSSIGLLQGPLTCKQATLSMGLGAGVGYRIPQPVTNAINALLRSLNVREEIQGAGGMETKPVIIVNMGRVHPALEACGA